MDNFTKQLLEANLVQATTMKELNAKEREITTIVAEELKDNPIKGSFDFNHLKEIHKALFENVYTFAGKDRLDMGIVDGFGKRHPTTKEITWFTDGCDVKTEADRLFKGLKDKNYLKDLKFLDFIKKSSDFFTALNNLHPFREGNGRTQRIFTEQLAKEAGWKLDLETSVTKQEMIDACNDGMINNKAKMLVLFMKNCEPLEKRSKTLEDKIVFFVENKKAQVGGKVYVKDKDYSR